MRRIGAQRDDAARVVEYQTLLARAEHAPVFGDDVNVVARTTIRFGVERHAAVEEATARPRRFFIADANRATVRGVDAHARVVSHQQCDRMPVAEPVSIRRARRRFVTACHDQTGA